MLEVRKVHCLSNRHVVSQDGTDVVELVRSRWRSRAEFTFQGRTFQLRKQGLFRSTYALMEKDSLLVEATRPSSWRSRLVFHADGRDFEIRNRSVFSSALVVKSGEALVGSIIPKGVLTTRLLVDLPDTLPMHLRVFMAWVALVLRDEAAAAAGAAS
jgi:hypothetical protein